MSFLANFSGDYKFIVLQLTVTYQVSFHPTKKKHDSTTDFGYYDDQSPQD